MKKKRVLAAMSGGVDSSAAAALLIEQGYDVIGATMLLFGDSTASADDARKVTDKLGIPHHVFDMRSAFKENVVNYFISEYQKGHTPNPCIECNKYLKFGELWQKAQELGCDYIATGHYASITENAGLHYLSKAENKAKDQSYFLYTLNQELLSHIIFPLSGFTDKEAVRQIAQKYDLPVAQKSESQDICFIPEGDTKKFLLENKPGLKKSGDIVFAQTGATIGKHDGTAFYTIGQRKGLGIAWKEPLYVTDILADENIIIVDTNENTFASSLVAQNLSFIANKPAKGQSLPVKAKIRYAHKEQPALLTMLDDNTARVDFETAQRAITKGQSVVFYEGDNVLGGGTIKKSD